MEMEHRVCKHFLLDDLWTNLNHIWHLGAKYAKLIVKHQIKWIFSKPLKY